MRYAIFFLLVLLGATPALAQDATPPASPDVEQGFSLMERGAKLLFQGLMSGMKPAMEDMGRALTDMQPALKDLMAMIGDLDKYHAPEVLENGDIIIRRKLPAELLPPAPEIDL